MLNSRYLRQITLSDIGIEGHNCIKNSKMLCIGAGGLGSPVLTYLAMSGVGTIGIIDKDTVSVSDLNRQFIFNPLDIGKKKVYVAKNFINKLNPDININCYDFFLNKKNANNIIPFYDIIIDCTDNLEAKYFINYYSIKFNIPMVYGAIYGFEGYIATFHHSYGACYNCLYNNVSKSYVPNCSEYGVLGSVTGVIGSLQALEAIKLILYFKLNYNFNNLISKLFIFNLKYLSFKILNLKKNNKCNICLNFSKKDKLIDNNLKLDIYKNFYLKEDDLNNINNLNIIDLGENLNFSSLLKKDSFTILKLPFEVIMNLDNIYNIIKNDIIYVFVCEYGIKSKLACQYLRLKGFKNIFYLIRDY